MVHSGNVPVIYNPTKIITMTILPLQKIYIFWGLLDWPSLSKVTNATHQERKITSHPTKNQDISSKIAATTSDLAANHDTEHNSKQAKTITKQQKLHSNLANTSNSAAHPPSSSKVHPDQHDSPWQHPKLNLVHALHCSANLSSWKQHTGVEASVYHVSDPTHSLTPSASPLLTPTYDFVSILTYTQSLLTQSFHPMTYTACFRGKFSRYQIASNS